MRFVIIGGGVAGGNVAVGLREQGFDGEIVIVGNEPDAPFGRPPLSKGYLTQDEDVWWVKAAEWYDENAVALETDSPAIGIDPSGHTVVLSDKQIDWDAICIATGARPIMPVLPGHELEGIFPLRTRADSDAIRAEAKRPGAKAIVGGMGFIGSEAAASIRKLGADVAAVFPGNAPLSSVLGPEIALRLSDIHRQQGVELHPGEKIAAFEGTGRVERVKTQSGNSIECTFVVLGLGVQPNVEFLNGSGIDIEDGVLVDAACQTKLQGIFAAGDVARHQHPLFGPIRIEHFNNAEKQAAHVAGAMLGKLEPYDYLHTFWSDQYDHNIEYVGYAGQWDRFIFRERDGLLGFYLTGNTVKAAVGLDRGGDPEAEPDSELAACAELIRRQVPVNPAQLADDDFPLSGFN